MARNTPKSSSPPQSVENKAKKPKDRKHSKPEQLSLFAWAGIHYSNTIELYHFIPKFYSGDVERVNGQYLPALERAFEYRETKYKVEIHPASLKDQGGVNRHYYPCRREEMIEAALICLASQGHGIFLDKQAGVMFTLGQIQRELARNGHTLSKKQIKDALQICAQTVIKLFNEDGTSIVTASMLQSLYLSTKDNWEDSKCFAQFHPLVTASIKAKTFRQLHHDTSMALASTIAYRLHLRLSHRYTQAGLLAKPYSILLSTLIRDFGLRAYDKPSQNLREVRKALEELKSKNVVLNYTINPILEDGGRKWKDALIDIQTHPSFNNEMKKANARNLQYDEVRAKEAKLIAVT